MKRVLSNASARILQASSSFRSDSKLQSRPDSAASAGAAAAAKLQPLDENRVEDLALTSLGSHQSLHQGRTRPDAPSSVGTPAAATASRASSGTPGSSTRLSPQVQNSGSPGAYHVLTASAPITIGSRSPRTPRNPRSRLQLFAIDKQGMPGPDSPQTPTANNANPNITSWSSQPRSQSVHGPSRLQLRPVNELPFVQPPGRQALYMATPGQGSPGTSAPFLTPQRPKRSSLQGQSSPLLKKRESGGLLRSSRDSFGNSASASVSGAAASAGRSAGQLLRIGSSGRVTHSHPGGLGLALGLIPQATGSSPALNMLAQSNSVAVAQSLYRSSISGQSYRDLTKTGGIEGIQTPPDISELFQRGSGSGGGGAAGPSTAQILSFTPEVLPYISPEVRSQALADIRRRVPTLPTVFSETLEPPTWPPAGTPDPAAAVSASMTTPLDQSNCSEAPE